MLPVQFLPLLLWGSVAGQPKPQGHKRKRVRDETPRSFVDAAASSSHQPVAAVASASSSSTGETTSLTFANPVQVQEAHLLGADAEESEYRDIELECMFEDACKLRLEDFFPLTTFPRPGCELTKCF